MGRSKQAPKIKQCASEGCTHPSECIVKVAGEFHDYCRAHIPANIEVVRDKFSCEDATCPFKRTHGLPEHRGASRCLFHATEGMIQTSTSFCGFPGCPKRKPIFGTLEPRHATRCGEHRLEGMVNVCDKMCVCGEHQATHPAPDSTEKKYCGTCAQRLKLGTKNEKSKKKCVVCGDFASYARNIGDRPTHCAEHGAPLGLIDVTHKKCEKCKKAQGRCTVFPDGSIHYLCVSHGGKDPNPICIEKNVDGTPCTTHAAFDPDDVKHPRFCKRHAPPGSANIHAILCECPARSRCTFNFPGLPARFCKDCKQPGMIDVVSTRCKICGERASYRGNQAPSEWFCIDHKQKDMIRSGSHPCCIAGCQNKEAIFGFPPADVRANPSQRCCKKHKSPEMIDIVHVFCKCPIHLRATFYLPDAEDGAWYCAACRPEGAISDNPTCDNCGNRAIYGPLYSGAIHCAEHAQEKDGSGAGAHDLFCEFVERFPKCQEKGCKMRPDFSVDDAYYPSHCGVHAPIYAVPIIEGVCSKCQNPRLIASTTQVCGYCENDLGERNNAQRLARERRMLKVLKECEIEPHSHNKTHPRLCAMGIKWRMDFLYESAVAIVLEDDEHQHANKIIAFGRDDLPPLLNLTDVIECAVVPAICDPDKPAKKGKSRARSVPHVDADGASTSAAATSIIQTDTPAEPITIRRAGYTRVKELARMIAIQQALQMPVIFVRYNPDKFTDHEGVKWESSRGPERDRIAASFVKELIRKHAENAQSLRGLYVSYLYYNGQRPGIADSFHIDVESRRIDRWIP